MTCIHTFSDGTNLIAHRDAMERSNEVLMVTINKGTNEEIGIHFHGDCVDLENNEGRLLINLIGFTLDEGKIINDGLATEFDKRELEIIYNAVKVFIADLNDLPNLYFYAKECKSLDNITITDYGMYITITDVAYFIISINKPNDYAPKLVPSQQECQDKIMKLVDRMVIHNPRFMTTKSARN